MDVLSPPFRRLLVHAILHDRSFLTDRRECLSVELFTDEVQKALVAVALEHFDTYAVPPDTAVVTDALTAVGWEESDIEDAIDEYNKPPTQVSFLRDRVLEFAQKRNLERTMERCAEILDGAPFEDLRQELLGAAFFGDQEHSPGVLWSDGMAERLRRYRMDERTGTVSTGIGALDSNLDGGGLAQGELGVILAPPNRGKSTVLISIGKGALMAGKRVVHYTLEMSADAVTRRYDMSLLGMTKAKLRRQQKTAWRKMQEVARELAEDALLVKEYPMHHASPATLNAHLDVIAQRDGFVPDLIIIDYGSLLRGVTRYDSRRDEVASVFREFHAMGKIRHVPIWTAHQTNRGGMERTKVLDMDDLGECFEIGPIADVIVSLNQNPDERRRGEARFHFAKNRESEAGITESVLMDYATATVKDYE